MTEAKQNSGVTCRPASNDIGIDTAGSVYRAHKNKILGNDNQRYHAPMEVEQGGLIEEIKTIARTTIEEDKTRTTRCMTLKSVDRVCYKIAMNEDKISQTKVYIALRTIGYNIRYHNKMQGNPDALQSMEAVISDCANTNDVDVIDMVRGYTLFPGARSVTFRMNKAKMGEAEKEAMACGITRSELNLFNVLAGIERVLSQEPYYIKRRDDRLFRASMDEFLSAKRKLEFRLVSLRSILSMV